MNSVAVNLAEALPAFGAAVRPRAGVQVHVVLEFELGGKLEIADAAAEVAGMAGVCGGKEDMK